MTLPEWISPAKLVWFALGVLVGFDGGVLLIVWLSLRRKKVLDNNMGLVVRSRSGGQP